MLQAFLDESRTNEKVPVVAVGGGIGSAMQWERLSKAWHKALKTEPSVKRFHAVDFETPEGRKKSVYKDWDETRRKQFNQELTDAIKCNHIGMCTGATVRVEEFEKIRAERKAPDTYNAYIFCAFMLLQQIALWTMKFHPNELVSYYFEQGGLHETGLKTIYEILKKDEDWRLTLKLNKPFIFAPKNSYTELQIADKLIYEAAKHASHYLDENPPEKHSIISPETGKKIWKTRHSSNEWVLSGLDIHVRFYPRPDIEEFFDLLRFKTFARNDLK